MNRIRSLDGLRAISIIMVLIGHAGGAGLIPKGLTSLFFYDFISNASLGVRIFFVISGFLITKLLLSEKEKTNQVSLRTFYIKRAFRIFPVFYAYIVVLCLLKWVFYPDIFINYYLIVLACFYLMNYRTLIMPHNMDVNGSWFTGHFWTLSLEEQFYLIWPFVFKKYKKETLIKIVLFIIVIMPVLRVLTYFLLPQTRSQLGGMLHTGGDAILFGCLGALLENKKYHIKIINNKVLMMLTLLYLFVVSLIIQKVFGGAFGLIIGVSLTNLCILIFIFWSIEATNIFTDFLNLKGMIWLGTLSYSIYVWQQLFLQNKINYFWDNKWTMIIVFLVASISYYLIEKPILNLRKKFIKK